MMARIFMAAVAGGIAGLLVFWLLRLWGVEPALAIAGLVATTLVVGRIIDQWCEQQQGKEEEEAGGEVQIPQPDFSHIPLSALAEAAFTTEEWRVVAANDAALVLFGQRVVGTDVRQTVRHPDVIEAVRLAMEGQAPIMREIAAYGHKEDLRLRVARFDGNRLLLTFADISQARLAGRMRADFVANASHELRTPLANLMGFIETLQGPAAGDPAASARFLAIMGREASRMARLIDDLLSLSRIELDRYVRPQSAIALPQLIDESVRAFAPQMEAGERELLVDMPEKLPTVVGDHDQLQQVMYNLLSNAFKYGKAATPIRISVRLERQPRGGPMLRIAVADEGEGIAPEHLPRLTERFYRVDPGRSNAMGGTGLGLAIVKHIVERHRGRVEIESQPGVGSTISFLLPAVTGEETIVTKA